MAEPKMTPQLQQDLQNLQALNQQVQAAMQQRAQFEAMKAENAQALDALKEAADNAPVYRSVGALLVQDSKKAAVDRLTEDQETMEVRLTRLAKQEAAIKESMAALQKKLQAALGPA